MFYLCYNIISVFLLVPVLIYHLYRSVSRGRPPALAERFGFPSDAVAQKIAGRPVIWLHAVSVGESIAARPLLKALRNRYPGHAILVSNTTETGRGVASGFPEIDVCIYFPFDFLPAVRRVLDLITPSLVVIMETEIWPNFTREARRRGIPVILANGRISDRSFRGYLRFSWFFRNALELFSRLCMQTGTDGERITAIGAPAGQVVTAGNLKYDIPFREVAADEKSVLRKRYAIADDATVITAASTHPGEEQHLISAYRELFNSHADLFLVLVPRHPERSGEVAALLERGGIPFRRRTALDGTGTLPKGGALLVDTVGEMMSLYALSDIAFVGGSLVPTGGHNLLEPASLGIPCLFGPHMDNFREIATLVLGYDAGIRIETPPQLVDRCRELIIDGDRRRQLGQNGLRMMAENGGATQKHMEIISAYL
ncbi:MAG: 3-deoxy-D-manno-octulosonic acid transferase [Geobacteraceae bacterium]|nr:3-deoxy-D-manno-octulosonic acid transferase [Geobacteraceae bacterium]